MFAQGSSLPWDCSYRAALPQMATSLSGTLLAFDSLASYSALPSASFALPCSSCMSQRAICQSWRYYNFISQAILFREPSIASCWRCMLCMLTR